MNTRSAWLVSTLLAVPMIGAFGADVQASPVQGSYRALSSQPVNWMLTDVGRKTVTLKITADYNDNNHGFNFNGYSKGAATITVPTHWTIKVAFTNKSEYIHHSFEVVPYAERTLETGLTPAFPGAITPQPTMGITSGTTQRFTFIAGKSGRYAVVCGVPGHDAGGMWDTLVISPTAKRPAVKYDSKQSGTTSGGQGTTSGGSSW